MGQPHGPRGTPRPGAAVEPQCGPPHGGAHTRLCLPHGADRTLQHAGANTGLTPTSSASPCSWSCVISPRCGTAASSWQRPASPSACRCRFCTPRTAPLGTTNPLTASHQEQAPCWELRRRSCCGLPSQQPRLAAMSPWERGWERSSRRPQTARTLLTAPQHTHGITSTSKGRGAAGTEMGIDGLKPTRIVAGRRGV